MGGLSGPLKGEEAWKNFQSLPLEMRRSVLNQAEGHLPSPAEVQFIMNTISMPPSTKGFDINTLLVKNLARQQAQDGAKNIITAEERETFQKALQNADLWLDPAITFDSLSEPASISTRSECVDETIDMWIKLAEPVAKSTSEALAQVIEKRFGNFFSDMNSAELLAGPIPMPLPSEIQNPQELVNWVASSAFALQVALTSSSCAKVIFSSFDLGIALSSKPSGCIVAQNIEDFANSLDIPHEEVYNYLALRHNAYARLFASTSWLMPQIVALITKYARGINIDLEAISNSVLENPHSLEDLAGSISMNNISAAETPEQKEVKVKLEQISALIEGWVDCVIWRAGSPFLPHISQLREMMQRRIALGESTGKAFESLIGLQLRPRLIREASQMWEKLTANEGIDGRDMHWSHPDTALPLLEPISKNISKNDETTAISQKTEAPSTPPEKDWDAGLEELLSDKKLMDEINNSDSSDSPDNPNDPSNSDSPDNSDDTDNSDNNE